MITRRKLVTEFLREGDQNVSSTLFLKMILIIPITQSFDPFFFINNANPYQIAKSFPRLPLSELLRRLLLISSFSNSHIVPLN